MPEKRRFRILLLAILTALLSIEVCMELRYARNEPVVTSEDTASVLRQFPQMEITEEDRAMMQDFFQCAAVGELLESDGSGDVSAVSEPERRAAAERYLSQESAASVIVNKIFYEVYGHAQEGTLSPPLEIPPSNDVGHWSRRPRRLESCHFSDAQKVNCTGGAREAPLESVVRKMIEIHFSAPRRNQRAPLDPRNEFWRVVPPV